MTANEMLLNEFYSVFVKANEDGMVNCYHPELVFRDAGFGELKRCMSKYCGGC
jgi:hypothetical protein